MAAMDLLRRPTSHPLLSKSTPMTRSIPTHLNSSSTPEKSMKMRALKVLRCLPLWWIRRVVPQWKMLILWHHLLLRMKSIRPPQQRKPTLTLLKKANKRGNMSSQSATMSARWSSSTLACATRAVNSSPSAPLSTKNPPLESDTCRTSTYNSWENSTENLQRQ